MCPRTRNQASDGLIFPLTDASIIGLSTLLWAGRNSQALYVDKREVLRYLKVTVTMKECELAKRNPQALDNERAY